MTTDRVGPSEAFLERMDIEPGDIIVAEATAADVLGSYGLDRISAEHRWEATQMMIDRHEIVPHEMVLLLEQAHERGEL